MTGITIVPYTTNSPQNSFLLESQGYVQGLALDDTVARLELAGGQYDAASTTPMWGGLPIEEYINLTGTGATALGGDVKLASSQATCTGFCTYQQMMHGVIGPGTNAPQYGAGDSVGFFRLGSNARLAVKCDPALITALTSSDGSISSQALYWDTTNYQITLTTSSNWALPTSIRLLAVNTNSKVVTYDSGTGALTWGSGDAAILLL